MKKLYILITLAFISCFGFAQNYNLGIVHINNYNFKVVAIPDFTSTGNTDVSDIGFTLVLPEGVVDVANPVGLLSSRPWTVDEFNAAFLTDLGLGDGSKDVFQFNLPPGQSEFSHNAGVQIDLVSFSITNSPVTGEMYFLLNNDPIAMGAGGVLDSFYSTNLGQGDGTLDYFSMPEPNLDSFMFSTLSLEDSILDDLAVKIYPNPASEFINISSSMKIDSTELFDLLGKRVLESKHTKQIPVDKLPNGVYLLKVNTENGSLTKKIIIE